MKVSASATRTKAKVNESEPSLRLRFDASFFVSSFPHLLDEKGYSQQQILRAQGLKEAKILEAEGIAIALEKIGRATQTESGQRALQFLFGRFWVLVFSSGCFLLLDCLQ